MRFALPRFLRPLGLAASLLLGAAAPAGLTVTDPWFRVITPQVPAGGYFTLHNGSAQPVSLMGARSSACGGLMLHRTEGDRMVPAGTLTVPPGGTLALAPGGLHLMCMHPEMVRGGTVPLTLLFVGGGTLETTVPVIGARDRPPRGGTRP